MVATSTAIGIGIVSFFVGGAIGVLVVSITAISKNDFGRDQAPSPSNEPDKGESAPSIPKPTIPTQLTFIGSSRRRPRRPRLLTAEQVAKRLGMSQRWVYDNHLDWPFTVRTGKRAIRFDEERLREWMAQRNGAK